MLTLLLSAFIATTPNIGEITAQADTVNRYKIDRKDVSDFDGSQLVGKSIAYYDILETKENGKVVRNHLITTEKYLKDNNNPTQAEIKVVPGARPDGESLIIRETTPGGKENLTYFVNDKKVDEKTFTEIKPSDIKSITVLKGKAAEEVYGSGTADGVVSIQTK